MSTPWVGSSIAMTRTSDANSLAIMTFCWLPPDRVAAGPSVLAIRMSSCSRYCCARRRNRRDDNQPRRATRSNEAMEMLNADDCSITRPRPLRSSGIRPMPSRCASRTERIDAESPASSHRPRSGTSPPTIATTVAAPEPKRPVTATISPVCTSRSIPATRSTTCRSRSRISTSDAAPTGAPRCAPAGGLRSSSSPVGASSARRPVLARRMHRRAER